MELKATITLTASPELLAVLGGFFKGSVKNEPVKEAPAKTTASAKIAAPATESGDGINITKIRELATKLSKEDGKGEQVKGLLKEFDCKALTNLKPDQYETFYSKLNSL